MGKVHLGQRSGRLITNTAPLRVRRGLLREGLEMVQDVIGCLIAVAFGVAVAFQIGGEA